MDGNDLIKFLRTLGVPLGTKIKSDSLDLHMKNKNSRAFIVGICRSFSAKNVIFNEEIEVEKNLTTWEPKLNNSVAELEIEMNKCAEEVCEIENYLKLLEEENSRLQESIKCLSNCTSKSDILLSKLCSIKEDVFSTCKGNIALFKNSSKTLKEDYNELYKFICKNDASPLLLFQLPLDTYRSDKSSFENHIKTYIVKQFEEKMAELAGENQPSTCVQKNPRELEHLVSGPDRDLYNQQLHQLDQLEISFAESLYVTSVQEAKIAGLEAGIKKAKQIKENSGLQRHFNSRLSLDVIQLAEERVHTAAKECVARRIGTLVIGNYTVKQRRQNYYLEKLNILEIMLQKQLALDKLLCIYIQLEGTMVNQACDFMDDMQHIISETVNSTSLVLSSMEECKFQSKNNDSVKHDDRFMQLLQCLLPEIATINETECHDIFMTKSLLHNMLQNYELQLVQNKRSDLHGEISCNSNIRKLLSNQKEENSNLKPNLNLYNLKHELDLQVNEFYISLERQNQCQALRKCNNLWAKFIITPESLDSLII